MTVSAFFRDYCYYNMGKDYGMIVIGGTRCGACRGWLVVVVVVVWWEWGGGAAVLVGRVREGCRRSTGCILYHAYCCSFERVSSAQ